MLAQVERLATLAGVASPISSLHMAAAAYCTIMNPDITPGLGLMNAVSSLWGSKTLSMW